MRGYGLALVIALLIGAALFAREYAIKKRSEAEQRIQEITANALAELERLSRPYRVVGRITVEGEPLRDHAVRVERIGVWAEYGSATTNTDALGEYALEDRVHGFPFAWIRFELGATGSATTVVSRRVSKDSQNSQKESRLDFDVRFAAVRGCVRFAATGEPVAHACVTIKGDHESWRRYELEHETIITSDANGCFASDAIPASAWVVTIEHDDAAPVIFQYAGSTKPGTLVTFDDDALRLDRGVAASGQATFFNDAMPDFARAVIEPAWSPEGMPIMRRAVTFDRRTGAFSVRGIAPGTHRLVLDLRDERSQQLSDEFSVGSEGEVQLAVEFNSPPRS